MRPSFGIGVLFWRLESPHGDPSKADEFLDYIVELQPKAVWLSFGANLRHWVDTFLERDDRRRERAGETGQRRMKVFVGTFTAKQALEAKSWPGVDVVVIQGE